MWTEAEGAVEVDGETRVWMRQGGRPVGPKAAEGAEVGESAQGLTATTVQQSRGMGERKAQPKTQQAKSVSQVGALRHVGVGRSSFLCSCRGEGQEALGTPQTSDPRYHSTEVSFLSGAVCGGRKRTGLRNLLLRDGQCGPPPAPAEFPLLHNQPSVPLSLDWDCQS